MADVDITPQFLPFNERYDQRQVSFTMPIGTNTINILEAVCKRCGTIVANTLVHDKWHDRLQRDLSMIPRPLA